MTIAARIAVAIVALLHLGFLAASRHDLLLFLLGCVIVAGLFGAVTAQPTILLTQALPGTVALVLVLAAARKA